MNTKNIIKNVLIRALPVAALAFVIAAVIAYQRGVYDISFIKRPEADTKESENVTIGDTTIADTTEASPPETTDSTDTAETTTPPETGSVIESFIAPLYSTETLLANGYTITDEAWSDGFALGLIRGVEYGNVLSIRNRTVEVPTRIEDEGYNAYKTVMVDAEEARPLVDVYMDYIIVDKGSTVRLMKADGTVLIEDLDIEKYQFSYTRDTQDRPIFHAEEQSRYNPKNTYKQYYYLSADGKFVASTYNDTTDGRGLYTNYPSYFGKNNYRGYIIAYIKEANRFAFANLAGTPVNENRYLEVFAFSEDFAAVVNENGLMSYVNKAFNAKIVSGTLAHQSYKNSSNRRVYDHYVLPDTFGKESIGFLYFDHGLVRVRRQVVDAPHFEMYGIRKIAEDEDILITTDGKQFITPTDYTVVAYSNGMILLEKDGFYGFMDTTGRWVVQPVYTVAAPFNEGLAVVGNEGAVGVIDTDGNFVIPQIFDHVGSISGGIIPAYDEDEGWFVFNKVTFAE